MTVGIINFMEDIMAVQPNNLHVWDDVMWDKNLFSTRAQTVKKQTSSKLCIMSHSWFGLDILFRTLKLPLQI